MGGCWLTLWLWQELRLDEFWAERLLPSRKGTRWDQVLFVLVAYRLLAPGSVAAPSGVYERSALADLLGADGALCDIHTLYRVTTGCSSTSGRCLITGYTVCYIMPPFPL